MNLQQKLLQEIEVCINDLPNLRNNKAQYDICLNRIKELQAIYKSL